MKEKSRKIECHVFEIKKLFVATTMFGEKRKGRRSTNNQNTTSSSSSSDRKSRKKSKMGTRGSAKAKGNETPAKMQDPGPSARAPASAGSMTPTKDVGSDMPGADVIAGIE